ncbi:MAG: protein phosphatase 2C domain-containing protein [Pseudomonadota bacterium]
MVSLSHEGLVRVNNEDCVRVVQAGAEHPAFAVLADGMGGLMGGEDAAHSAVEAVRHAICDAGFATKTEEDLDRIVAFAHTRVSDYAKELNYFGRMGTTLLFWVGPTSKGASGLFAHVGDSRLYHYSQGLLTLLSRDQTVAQRLEDTGAIGPGKAKYHRQKHVLTQALGLPGMLQPQTGSVAGDGRLLICSDGLSDLVSEHRLNELLALSDLTTAAGELLRYALDEGGTDNISMALIDLN